ncbi:MAG: hypothetical protein RBT80_16720 [Candidatus Vecturithrix sp.]|nr:hypothetical protein [Candidatus Vecturithrix sp.]
MHTKSETILFVLFSMLIGILMDFGLPQASADEDVPESMSGHGRNVFVVAPLIGVDRNTLQARGMRGKPIELKDTGPEYGVFALWSTKHFTVNNFVFWADVNNADVFGNVLFANYYYNPESRVTLNLGLGYIYHTIETKLNDITVKTPLPKLGVRIGLPEWGMYLNPYIGWTSEEIETTYGDRTDDAVLYGLTIGWNWRFLGAYLKYYYQDVLDSDDVYHVARFRGNLFLTRRFGITTRFEYMEHSTSDDISFLIGPAVAF